VVVHNPTGIPEWLKKKLSDARDEKLKTYRSAI